MIKSFAIHPSELIWSIRFPHSSQITHYFFHKKRKFCDWVCKISNFMWDLDHLCCFQAVDRIWILSCVSSFLGLQPFDNWVHLTNSIVKLLLLLISIFFRHILSRPDILFWGGICWRWGRAYWPGCLSFPSVFFAGVGFLSPLCGLIVVLQWFCLVFFDVCLFGNPLGDHCKIFSLSLVNKTWGVFSPFALKKKKNWDHTLYLIAVIRSTISWGMFKRSFIIRNKRI